MSPPPEPTILHALSLKLKHPSSKTHDVVDTHPVQTVHSRKSALDEGRGQDSCRTEKRDRDMRMRDARMIHHGTLFISINRIVHPMEAPLIIERIVPQVALVDVSCEASPKLEGNLGLHGIGETLGGNVLPVGMFPRRMKRTQKLCVETQF